MLEYQEIRKAIFVNLTWPIWAFSSLILTYRTYVSIQIYRFARFEKLMKKTIVIDSLHGRNFSIVYNMKREGGHLPANLSHANTASSSLHTWFIILWFWVHSSALAATVLAPRHVATLWIKTNKSSRQVHIEQFLLERHKTEANRQTTNHRNHEQHKEPLLKARENARIFCAIFIVSVTFVVATFGNSLFSHTLFA